MFRQGDILLELTNVNINDFEIIDAHDERHILAHGEATGHTHSVSANNSILCRYNGRMFLMVIKETSLDHQEHSSIILPVGNYEVIRQREYTPQGVRDVAD